MKRIVFCHDTDASDKFVLNFSLFFIEAGGLYFNDSSIMKGIIVKNANTEKYAVIFNDNWTGWDTYTGDSSFSSLLDIRIFFEEYCPESLLAYAEEKAQLALAETKSSNAWFRYIKKVYNTVLNALNYHSVTTPAVIFNNEEITVTCNKSKVESISLYERSPMRLLDICIIWHGVGTVMFKLNQNYKNGKCTLIPICIYQDYDKGVKYWNDIRFGYTSNTSNAMQYSETIWKGWFTTASREKQLELLLEFDTLADVYSQIKNVEWLRDTFMLDYFWKVATKFECLNAFGVTN